MRFFKIKKGDQLTTNDGETLEAVRLHNTGDVGGHTIEFNRFYFDCVNKNDYSPEDPEGEETGCDLCCDTCRFYQELVSVDVLTPADLRRRGIGVNCTIIFGEDKRGGKNERL